MATLEERGYLVQPHTSAGRIPTDHGYRVYVNSLADQEEPLSAGERLRLRRRLGTALRGRTRVPEEGARALATVTNYASVGSQLHRHFHLEGPPNILTHPEFRDCR